MFRDHHAKIMCSEGCMISCSHVIVLLMQNFRQRTRNFIQWLLFSYFALGRIRAEQKKYVFVQQAANCSSTRQECRGHYKCRLGVVIYLAISPGLHVRHLLV